MLYTISQEFFDGKEDRTNLNRVWHTSLNCHTFYQFDDDDIDKTMDSEWFSDLSPMDKKLYQEAVTAAIQMGFKAVKIEIGRTHSAYEAYHYLSSPLKIILENGDNDAHFMNAIFRCFNKDSKEILEKMEHRHVVFDMGGGSSIKQKLKTELNTFNGGNFPKDNHEYLKCLVILDSDKRFPDEDLSKEKLKLIQYLESIDISYHILEKREMENYLPDDVYSEIQIEPEYVEAFLRLEPVQKDFFDIECGFPNKNFNNLTPEFQQFYGDIRQQDKEVFRRSNLKKLSGTDVEDFKNQFPQLFNSNKVTKHGLKEKTKHQTDPNELVTIISKIRELL